MLPPAYLEALPENILKLYRKAELAILEDMARRLAKYDYWTPVAEHQKRVLREAGRSYDEILSALSALSGKATEELRRMTQDAAACSLAIDEAAYKAAGMQTPVAAESEKLTAILNAGYKAARRTLLNLTQTTARETSRQFTRALDRAWLSVSSGAMDVNTAVKNAVKELAEGGVKAVRYSDGRCDTLEVAVRRAVVTGVNQTALQLQEELAAEVGCDLVETTAHAGARPEHALWQGKIFSLSGNSSQYPSLREATGYGTGAGLGGWNCRHSFRPYLPGSPKAYTEETLQEFDAPKYEYNGEKLTEYEAAQAQRYNERQLRRWRREYAAMDAAGLDTAEAAAKVRYWQERQTDFLKQTGLKRQYGREQISVVNSGNRGIMDTESGSVFIGSIDKPIEQRHTGKGNPNAILHFDVELNNRQQRLLDALPAYNSRTSVPKGDVSMTDLAALTAKTGDEFAMFTREGTRLIVRGNSFRVEITPEEAYAMGRNGYVWSGHTHPGFDMNVLQPSDGDYVILNQYNQDSSSIYNSTGHYLVFERTEPYV